MNDRMRNAYMTNTVDTASPAVLLVRLYDRLLVDLQRAEAAIDRSDVPAANDNLTHAQDIVTELLATLDAEAWAGGPALAQVYEFALTELVQANVAKDAGRVRSVRELFEPLRDAWREAAAQSVSRAPSAVSA